MKNLIFTLAAFLVLSISVNAQGPQRGGTPEEMAKKQTEKMKKDLSLSEDQVTKVSAINLKYAKKIDEVRNNASGDRAAMRESMQPIRKARNAEMKKVLSEDQYKTMVEKDKEMMEKRRQGGGQGRGPR
ncbi:DUF4890 domain-containing protein [Labilibacter marinus]|uniref:DUF4890 domain-containing protein n=1 Tax=Labilibacter marinus TaxID=1477105 RepID=UPI00094FB7FF|nr:DUF4890 domain-containing protein [Labilibacter marinus]